MELIPIFTTYRIAIPRPGSMLRRAAAEPSLLALLQAIPGVRGAEYGVGCVCVDIACELDLPETRARVAETVAQRFRDEHPTQPDGGSDVASD